MIAFHPFAEIFPLVEGIEFDELVADIKTNGLIERIHVLDGKILDGRNRYRAAVAAGLLADDDTPEDRPGFFDRFVPEVDGAPLKFVISKNLRRRHLDDEQRRLIAARLVNMRPGRPSENPAECGVKVTVAAELLNTDEAGVERARHVLAHAEPEIAAAIDHGKLSVAAAAQASKLAPDMQRKIAEQAEAGDINAARTVIKQEARSAREAHLAKQQMALPQKRYGVILADPEWRFEPWSRETGMDRAADNHYPTSCTEVIAARDVPAIAADDCVLYLWATTPMLPHALLVMAAWGFDYKSHMIWRKPSPITGYWSRSVHELLLIGSRGSPPAPAPGTQPLSVIDAPAPGQHSAKPEAFLEIIEKHFPNMPKIELNRRGAARPGWDAWGNESIPTDSSGSPLQFDSDGVVKEEERVEISNAESP